MNLKNYRRARRILESIPKGLYCYEITGFKYNEKWKMGLPVTKGCSYYDSSRGYDGWCCLIKENIEDSCKSCGYRYRFDKDREDIVDY